MALWVVRREGKGREGRGQGVSCLQLLQAGDCLLFLNEKSGKVSVEEEIDVQRVGTQATTKETDFQEMESSKFALSFLGNHWRVLSSMLTASPPPSLSFSSSFPSLPSPQLSSFSPRSNPPIHNYAYPPQQDRYPQPHKSHYV